MSEARQNRRDLRTWSLLVLALVPVCSVLLAAGWFWSERGNEIAEFESDLVSIEATFELHQIAARITKLESSLVAASSPGASEAIRRSAEDDLEMALDAIDSVESTLDPLITRVGRSDTDSELEIFQFIGDSVGFAEFVISTEVVGTAPSPQMDSLATLTRDNAAGIVIPYRSSGSPTIADLYDVIGTTIFYYEELDRDRSAVALALSQGFDLTSRFEEIATSPARDRAWHTLVDSRSFNAIPQEARPTWLGTDVDPSAPLLLDRTEPLAALLQGGPPPASAAERDRLNQQVAALASMLNTDIENAYGVIAAEASMHLESLRRDRQLTIVASGLMAAFALALSGLTILEVRQRQRIEEAHGAAITQLAQKAHTDATTGAWNRHRLEANLPRVLDRASAAGEVVVLVYIDLDRFKAVNDVWGHHTGDELLSITTRRLWSFGEGDLSFEVVRFGGDEFVLYARSARITFEQLNDLGERLGKVVAEPMKINGRAHVVSASIGIAMSEAGSTVDSILLEADSSMILAKRTMRGTSVVYNRDVSRTGELIQALPGALASGEICCHLQPIYDVKTGEIARAEALARWIRPSGELVSPAIFVPLVESFGLADQLTTAMVRSVGRVLEWPLFPEDLRVWVNVSPLELEVSNFATRFIEILRREGIAPSRVGIEITESAAVRDPVGVGIELEQLRAVGLRVAIDDFGSGYTPLGYLRDMPFDVVKIDRTLISHIDSDPANQHLVIGIVGLASELNMQIIAEGVERTEEQLWLADHGVSYMQGFLMARPGAAESLDWASRLEGSPRRDVDAR